MKKTKRHIKLTILLCCMTFLISLKVYADHTHTDKCYGGTKHICNGNETTYGSCYSNKNVTYHTHIGKEGTTANGCYTKENIIYHKHVGSEGTTANGCYTKENITYHKHNDNCYKEKNNECQHIIDMGNSNNLKIMDYYNCPNCSNEDFYGYYQSLSCDTTIHLYAGECENCGYKGNATITKTIINNNPAQISYSHNTTKKELSCGKTEQSIDKIVYTLNCGKTEQSIEKAIYTLNCGKTEKSVEKTTYILNCGKTEQSIEKTTYLKTCKKTSGNYYNSKGEKISPTCNQVIVSIKPKTEKQTTFNPDFTLVATYLDGHIAEIKPSIANYNENQTYKNEKVTLTYNGFIGSASNKSSISTYIYLTTPITPTPTQTITPTPTLVVIPTTNPTPTEIIVDINNNASVDIDIDGSFVLETPTINNSDNTNNNIKEEVVDKNNENNTSDLLGNVLSNNTIDNKEENDTQEIIDEPQNDESKENINKENNKKENDKIIITIVIFVILLCFLILLILSIVLLNKKEKKENVDNTNNLDEYKMNLENEEINVIPPIINGSDNNYK